MRAQDFIADETNRAMEAIIQQAKNLPADKLTWKPMDEGRDALDMLAECAIIGAYYPMLLQTRQLPEFTDEMMASYAEAKAKLDTIEKAETALRKATEDVCAAYRAVPDSDLEVEMKFFGPGMWKLVSVMNAHAWNMHYHTGQICYIQTLLGDKKMG